MRVPAQPASVSMPRTGPSSRAQLLVAPCHRRRVLERALRIDSSTAAFYVQQAGCDVRVAIEKAGDVLSCHAGGQGSLSATG